MFNILKVKHNVFVTAAMSAAIAFTLGACGGGDGDVAASKSAATSAKSPLSLPLSLPLATITDNLSGQTATGPITFTISFDRDVGTSLTADDIDVAGGAKGAFARLSGSLATLVVMPDPNTQGAVQLRLAQGSVTDATGAGNAAVSVSTPFNTQVAALQTILVSFDEAQKANLIGLAGVEDVSVVADPSDSTNKVARIVKSVSAEAQAGATVAACPNGKVPRLPFSADLTKMTARIWSPVAGIPVRLKVENAADPSQSVETESVVSVAEGWQKLSFDFAVPVTGTRLLNLSSTYDKVSIYFDYGTMGAATGTRTYLVDDVAFVGSSFSPSCASASDSTGKVGTTTNIVDKASPTITGIDEGTTTTTANADAGTTINPLGAMGEQPAITGQNTKRALSVSYAFHGLYYYYQGGVTAEYLYGSISGWSKFALQAGKAGLVIRGRFKAANGVVLGEYKFEVGTTESHTLIHPGTNKKYTFGIKIKQNNWDSPSSEIYCLVEALDGGGGAQSSSISWLGAVGGERYVSLYDKTFLVNDRMRDRLRANNGAMKIYLGSNVVRLSLRGNDVYMGIHPRSSPFDSNTPMVLLANDFGVRLTAGIEIDVLYGAAGEVNNNSPVGLVGPSIQGFIQIGLVNPRLPRIAIKLRSVFSPSALLSCGDDGCTVGNAVDVLARQEVRLSYAYPHSDGTETMVQLVGIPASQALWNSGLSSTPEGSMKLLSSSTKGVRIYVSRENVYERALTFVASKIAGDQRRPGLKRWVAAELIKKFGEATPDGFAIGAVTFPNPTARASIPGEDAVFAELTKYVDVGSMVPISPPPWADSLQENITELDTAFRDFLDVQAFLGRIPTIGSSYKYSPRDLFRQMDNDTKERIIKRVLSKAISLTFAEGVPKASGGINWGKQVVPLRDETTLGYNTRLAGILSENAIRSLGEIFNSEEFWREVAKEAFGELAEELKNYATRVASFIALGGTAAAAAATLAGGIIAGSIPRPGSEVPGYTPPRDSWNISTNLQNGVTAQYKIGDGFFRPTMPRELPGGAVLTVRFTAAGFTRDEDFVIGTAEGKKDLTPQLPLVKLEVWSERSDADRIYTIGANYINNSVPAKRWKIDLGLESGITARLTLASSGSMVFVPSWLAQGTNLKVQFTMGSVVRTKSFTVGVASAKDYINWPAGANPKLYVWSTLDSSGVYSIRAEKTDFGSCTACGGSGTGGNDAPGASR